MRTILGRYLLRRFAWASLLGALLIGGVVLMLQLLRLGHHLAGAPISWPTLATIVAASLPTLALHALPLGLFAGVLFALGSLAEGRQLLAVEAVGLSAGATATRAALALGLVFATATAGASVAEPRALGRLDRALGAQAARALLIGAPARTFHAIGPGATIYFEALHDQGGGTIRLEGLLLARGGAREVMLAREARLRFVADAAAVELDLRQVELQSKRDDGGLRRLRAGRYRERLDLRAALGPHFGFIAARARRDPLAGSVVVDPAHCLALALLAVAVGRRTGRRRMLGTFVGAVVVVAYLLGAAVAERWLGVPWGPVAWAALAAAGGAVVASRPRGSWQ